uniref:ARID domain-containing protein n=1 Tax=Triticum urartu TaxID=4572 RepID=A0A8R7TGD7_TRIUA
MPNGEPAPGDGQTEAADTVDSVKDSANPESAEADVEVEEQGEDEAMVDADADADAVGSTKNSAVLEEEGAEEVGEEHKGDALVDAAATTVASLDDSGKVEAQGAEEEVEERLGDTLVDVSVAHQVKTEAQGHEGAETEGEAQGNEVVETKVKAQGEEGAELKDDTQGNEAAEMDVDKAGNGDEHTEVRVDGDKGSLLKEEIDNGGDNKKDANGEDELVSSLAGEGENQNLSDKVSNNSFMFDYTRGGDDSGTEEEQAEFIKELDRFYTMKLMEFKPPKFYGEGLNCLKLWRQVTGLGGYDQVLIHPFVTLCQGILCLVFFLDLSWCFLLYNIWSTNMKLIRSHLMLPHVVCLLNEHIMFGNV